MDIIYQGICHQLAEGTGTLVGTGSHVQGGTAKWNIAKSEVPGGETMGSFAGHFLNT